MYQLIFRHYGSDDIDGSVQICIEHDFGEAKMLVHTWMIAYVEYVKKSELNEIDENENLSLEEKFFNEYTFGGTNDIAEIVLYKLKTMKELANTFEEYSNVEDFTLIQAALFDPIYKVSYSKEKGIVEV